MWELGTAYRLQSSGDYHGVVDLVPEAHHVPPYCKVYRNNVKAHHEHFSHVFIFTFTGLVDRKSI
jgi:hypothetical protein